MSMPKPNDGNVHGVIKTIKFPGFWKACLVSNEDVSATGATEAGAIGNLWLAKHSAVSAAIKRSK